MKKGKTWRGLRGRSKRYVTPVRETCIKLRKTPEKPVVGIQLGKVFNEVVTMDVGEPGEKFLVMIDLAPHYCQEGWKKNKIPKEIITVVVERWVEIFGALRMVLNDNRLKFQNEEIWRMADRFQIELLGTVAESPWSNGVCERMVK